MLQDVTRSFALHRRTLNILKPVKAWTALAVFRRPTNQLRGRVICATGLMMPRRPSFSPCSTPRNSEPQFASHRLRPSLKPNRCSVRGLTPRFAAQDTTVGACTIALCFSKSVLNLAVPGWPCFSFCGCTFGCRRPLHRSRASSSRLAKLQFPDSSRPDKPKHKLAGRRAGGRQFQEKDNKQRATSQSNPKDLRRHSKSLAEQQVPGESDLVRHGCHAKDRPLLGLVRIHFPNIANIGHRPTSPNSPNNVNA